MLRYRKHLLPMIMVTLISAVLWYSSFPLH